ncbi:hypothetical protein COOONC_14944 [Cooperia oncophora]
MQSLSLAETKVRCGCYAKRNKNRSPGSFRHRQRQHLRRRRLHYKSHQRLPLYEMHQKRINRICFEKLCWFKQITLEWKALLSREHEPNPVAKQSGS